jgi:hypothetical protein
MSHQIVPIVGALIVVVGIVIGLGDLRRFRWRRVSAIANVCFAESIRRRILWITPLAILGVLAVSQLTHPADEQDAIRQTTRFCLFASGLIVIIAAVLLSATNLPKEIENRVIFTVVTKPTTRLEIVLGKVLGFAQVSAMILLIMGLFSWGYLRLRAWNMERRISAALAAGTVDPESVPSARHFVQAGLLNTKSLAWPATLSVYSRLPCTGDAEQWMGGGRSQYISEPFALTDADRREINDFAGQKKAMFLVSTLRLEQHAPTPQEETDLKQGQFAREEDLEALILGPPAPTTGPATPVYHRPLPQVGMQILSAKGAPIAAEEISLGHNITAPPPAKEGVGEVRSFPTELSGNTLTKIFEAHDPAAAPADLSVFTVEVAAVTPTVEYAANNHSTFIGVYDVVGGRPGGTPLPPPGSAPAAGEYVLYSRADGEFRVGPVTLKAGDPIGYEPSTQRGMVTAVAGGQRVTFRDADTAWLRLAKAYYGSDPSRPGVPVMPTFLARTGRNGLQIRGEPDVAGREGVSGLGVYHFTNTDVGARPDGKVTLQVRLYVDRGGDLDATRNASSQVAIRVRNRTTGQISDPVTIIPETNRTDDIDVPAEFTKGGDFDVIFRGLTPGQWLGLQGPTASTPSAAVVTARGSFEFNLFKSLFILWLLAVLVTVIAFFCSTFLSWPIAVVLTLLLLLGRWGVDELGDALDPGAARSTVTDLFGFGWRDPEKQAVVTQGMEGLAAMLRNVATVLPDVSRFPVMDDIDRGVTIPGARLGRAAAEVAFFGLPLLMLSYVIMRNKEVAP